MTKVTIGKITDSCLGKMLDKEKNKGIPKPYLANINVRWGDFDTNSLSYMRFEENEDERYGIKDGDLIVCEGGEPGRCAIWDGRIADMKIQKALHRVRAKSGYDIRYIYYWMLLAGKNNALEKYFTGSTIKHLPGDRLKEIELEMPNYKEQVAVADLLSCLDLKIRTNAILNDNLQQVIKSCFDFMFATRKPNGIISDILQEHPKSTIQVNDSTGILGDYPFFTSGEAINEWQSALVDGMNCYLSTGGNATIKGYYGKAAYSTDTWCVCGKGEYSFYLFCYLKSIIRSVNDSFFAGSGLKHLQKDSLLLVNLYIPSEKELEKFNSIVKPAMETMTKLFLETKKLKQQRDFLLPLLMNGQATIAE